MKSLFDLFRSNLKLIRQDRDLSQEELSEACHYDPSYIGHIERGSNRPSLEVLFRLARALRVRIADFFVKEDGSEDGSHSIPRYSYRHTDSLDAGTDTEGELSSIIFEAAHHPILLLDDAGEILLANPAAEDLLNQKESNLQGKRPWELMIWSDDQVDQVKKGVHNALSGEFQEDQFEVQTNESTLRSMTVTLSPVIEHGEAVDFVVLEAVLEGS